MNTQEYKSNLLIGLMHDYITLLEGLFARTFLHLRYLHARHFHEGILSIFATLGIRCPQ